MCSGSNKRDKYKKKQRRLEKKAKRRQKKLDRLAAERTKVAEAQAAQLAALEDERDLLAAQQREKADVTRALFEQKQADIKANAAEKVAAFNKQAKQTARRSARQIRNLGVTNRAVSSSLRIIATAPTAQAPTAQQSTPSNRRRGAATTQTGLRLGSQPRSSGVNLSR